MTKDIPNRSRLERWRDVECSCPSEPLSYLYVPVTSVIHPEDRYLLRTCEEEGTFMDEETELKLFSSPFS